jgi:hypothetical protein
VAALTAYRDCETHRGEHLIVDCPGVDLVAGEPMDTGSLLVAASKIRMENATFAWYPYCPLGALTVLAGIGGLGKSHLAIEMTARATRGQLAGDLHDEPVNVVVATAEDSLSATMVPRLVATGADLDRITFVRPEAEFCIPDDVSSLAKEIDRVGARILVIDPLVAFVPLRIDAHKDQHARNALKPLATMATEADIAVIAVMHLNKSAEAGALFLRVSGSVGFMNAARSALLVAQDPKDEQVRVMAHGKYNLSEPGEAVSFRIEGVEVDGDDDEPIRTSRMAWLGASDLSIGELLRHDHRRDAGEGAESWLVAQLSHGPQPTRWLKVGAEEAGIKWRTVERAKDELGVIAERVGGLGAQGNWTWRLPNEGEVR